MAKTKTMQQKYPKPAWLKVSEEELVKLITTLSEKYQPAQVGLILRDQYGIPTTKVYGKKLGQYLEQIGKKINPDLKNIEKKVDKINDHLKKHITDRKAKHMLQKSVSKLNSLRNYSKRKTN
jgi:small subunit ribosomal protein S15